MKGIRSLLSTRNPSKEDVSEFIRQLEANEVPCATFVNEASTAKVFRVCGTHKSPNQCSTKCVALKVPLLSKPSTNNSSDAKVQQEIQTAIKDTPAAAHFNRVLSVLPSDRGSVIVLEFEEKKLTFHSLSDVLTKVQISEALWKSINFQLISTLYIAQQKVPGFTHNDTHTENILVVPNTTNHVCTVVSPAGRQMSHYSSMLIKIIDFGQVLATDPKLQTKDGKLIWKPILWKNKMIDFLRFATWVVFDLEDFETNEQRDLPPWFAPWMEFVLRFLDPHFFALYKVPNADGKFIDTRVGRGMAPNDAGIAWMNANFGEDSPFGLGNMLDDPYFDGFVTPELRFSAQIKPRLS
jgi:hypothetical protein